MDGAAGAAWEPILAGRVADDARARVRALVDELARADVASEDVPAVALFLAYAAGTDDAGAAAGDAHARVMDRLVEIADQPPATFGLFGRGALSGRAFVLAHIADGVDAYLASADAVLDELLAAADWLGDYDLITGLTGAAVYLVERAGTSPRAASALGHLVRHLDALHRDLPDGITWWTPARILPASQARLVPDGYYNCGVAHGVPGVIAVLAKIAARPDAPPRARPLCDGAARWLHAQRLDDPGNRLPAWIVPGQPPVPTRTAWCYGDAGAAAALWSAAARLGAPPEACAALARDAAARPVDRCRVADAPLCHGAFGLAHLFNRCYQASGDARLCDAARGWYERGLAMPPTPTRHDLLEGTAGIGLALLAAITPVEPAWDAMLACDIPVRDAAR